MPGNDHTPEPWDFHVADNAGIPHVSVYAVDGGCTIARMGDLSLDSDCPLDVDIEDARRICDCVNAFAGIHEPQKALDAARGILELILAGWFEDDAEELYHMLDNHDEDHCLACRVKEALNLLNNQNNESKIDDRS